jgi:DNA-directed RNA polymerase specialized sigma subunit
VTDELFAVLTKPRNIKAEMRRIDARIEDTRLMMLPSAIRYDTDKVISSPSDPMLKFAEKIDELEQKKKKFKEEYLEARSILLSLVDKLSDNVMKDIIQGRYMSEMKFRDIVEILPVEEAQMYRLHNKAIEEMEKMIKDDSE